MRSVGPTLILYMLGVALTIKTKKGKASHQQKQFLKAMQKAGAIAGVCRSKEDAKKLIKGE